MSIISQTPYFGIFLTFLFYVLGNLLYQKTNFILFNPLLFSIFSIILILLINNIPYDNYYLGGSTISYLITPATIALAIKLEENYDYFKNYAFYIIISIIFGIILHTITILVLAKVFNIDIILVSSLYAKSITTAMAIDITASLDGIVPLTVVSVIITGIIGSLSANYIFKRFNISHPIAQGITLGTSSHAMGTSHAIQLGDIQGAMSSVSLVITGLIVTLTAPLGGMIINLLFS